MKKTSIFYYFLTTIFITLLGTTLVGANSNLGLEVKYPSLTQVAPPPQVTHGYLVDYIKYIFGVAIFLAGIVALVAFLKGGFSYLTSVGNPSRMRDARDQILAGILGLIIVLGSFILLNTINPKLTEINPPAITGVGRGIIVYSDENCGDGSNALPGVLKPLPEGVIYERVEWTKALSSQTRLPDGSIKGMTIRSLYSFNSGKELVLVEFYRNKECQGQPFFIFSPSEANKCYPLETQEDVQCIKLKWHIPGVWLFAYDTEDQPPNPESPTGPFAVLQMDAPSLPEEVAGKVKYVALVDDELKHFKYGVILHEKPGPRYKVKGWAHPYFPKKDPELSVTTYKTTNENAYSATVFIVDENAPSNWIRLCEFTDCQPALVKEGGESVSKPAERYYKWPGGSNPPVSSATPLVVELEEVKGIPPEYARGALLHENQDPWWVGTNPDTIAICEALGGINTIGGLITQWTGKCGRGVSAIELEEGSSYILILWATQDKTPEWVEGARGDAPALIIDKTTRKLIDFGFNEQLGMFLVIKVKRSF